MIFVKLFMCVCPFVLQPEGEDELKRRQLMELAIINGTYRDTKSGANGPPGVPDASSPNSISPITGTNNPAAMAAAVVSRKSACCA